MFFCSFKQDEKSTADAEQVDEEDAWVVENHHIQDWDPVSTYMYIKTLLTKYCNKWNHDWNSLLDQELI